MLLLTITHHQAISNLFHYLTLNYLTTPLLNRISTTPTFITFLGPILIDSRLLPRLLSLAELVKVNYIFRLQVLIISLVQLIKVIMIVRQKPHGVICIKISHLAQVVQTLEIRRTTFCFSISVQLILLLSLFARTRSLCPFGLCGTY